jgi:MFS family permease
MVSRENNRWNYRVLLSQGILLDLSQTLSSPRLVLPFLYLALGAPAFFAGMLIPIVQIARMIGQVVSAPFVSTARYSKWYMALGILTTTASLALIGLTGGSTPDDIKIIIFLTVATIVGLGQGLSRLAFQNMLGYIVQKPARRTLLFAQTGLSGLLAIGVAWSIQTAYSDKVTPHVQDATAADTVATTDTAAKAAGHATSLDGHLILLWIGIGVGLLSGLISMMIRESPSVARQKELPDKETSNKLFSELFKGISAVRQVAWFRRFVIARILFLSVELAIPFYVIYFAEQHKDTSNALSIFVIATSLGLAVGGLVWSRYSRWPLSNVMSFAAGIASVAAMFAIGIEYWGHTRYIQLCAVVFFFVSIADQGISSARKIYIANVAAADERAYYIAISDTLVGAIAILIAFLLGILAQFHDEAWPIIVLGSLNVITAFFALRLRNMTSQTQAVPEH